MEILGEINDISVRKGDEAKIKIRTVDGSDVIINKIEIVITKNGLIINQ